MTRNGSIHQLNESSNGVRGRDPLVRTWLDVLLDAWRIFVFGFNAHDREQWQPEIAHIPEHSMQRGLIDYRAGQERVTVLFQRDGHALEPAGPTRTEMALDPDLVDLRLACVW